MFSQGSKEFITSKDGVTTGYVIENCMKSLLLIPQIGN